MRIRRLSLENFRSYDALALDMPDGGSDLFVGSNGSGKTNILEAISLLSTAKSCLGVQSPSMIRWGRSYYRVQADASSDGGAVSSFEIVAQLEPRKEKACFYEDVRLSFSRFIGLLPTILFQPADLDLFIDGPARRRMFLDAILVQLSSSFLRVRLEYEQVLKQRNALLRLIADHAVSESDLDPWCLRLAELGSQLQFARMEFIDDINLRLADTLVSLGEYWPECSLRYVHASVTVEELQAAFLSQLHAARTRDILLRSTSVGPHREDWRFLVDGHDLAHFASRGQQRTALLALLFLSTLLFQSRRREKPIILLDDVFSELDDIHQSHLLAVMKEHHVFFTATHVPSSLPSSTRLWSVEHGAVRPVIR